MGITLKQVMDKAEVRLSKVNPIVGDKGRQLVTNCFNRGVPIVITQGLRTMAEQQAIYNQGRTTPGKIVSNALPGYSYHNFGLAIDFALLLPDGKEVSWDMLRDGDKDKIKDWDEVVIEAEKLGFEWGGRWQSFRDNPHFQMTFGLTTAQLRAGKKPPTTVTGSKPNPTPTPTPTPSATTHKVVSGDSLSAIAVKYGTTVAKLKSLNGLSSDLIKVGQVLKVKEVAVTTPPVKPGVDAPIVPYPGILKNGSKGKDVERVQRAVGVNPDGVFGAGTEKAVRAYQSRKGLVADGIVGQKTWNIMF